MSAKSKAILVLRILCGLAITVGITGVIGALMTGETVHIFWVNVPGWVIGASAVYMGIRYWRRIPELEKGMQQGGTFSWTNFRKQN